MICQPNRTFHVDGIRAMLKGGVVYKDIKEAFAIKSSLPHGHVAAVYGIAKNLDLILHRKSSRVRDIALGAISFSVNKDHFTSDTTHILVQ